MDLQGMGRDFSKKDILLLLKYSSKSANVDESTFLSSAVKI